MTFYLSLLISILIGASAILYNAPVNTSANITEIVPTATVARAFVNLPEGTQANVPDVPFYSQFSDISDPEWKKLGCGIADLAMLINFYKPGTVSVNELLQEGIAAGAFINGAGWSHQGLVSLARVYGFQGSTHDLSDLDMDAAFAEFEKFIKNGPVIASVYYKFDPNSPIPHLAVINGIKEGVVYYNDPAGQSANEKISIADFMRGWKKRFIVIRPSA